MIKITNLTNGPHDLRLKGGGTLRLPAMDSVEGDYEFEGDYFELLKVTSAVLVEEVAGKKAAPTPTPVPEKKPEDPMPVPPTPPTPPTPTPAPAATKAKGKK